MSLSKSIVQGVSGGVSSRSRLHAAAVWLLSIGAASAAFAASLLVSPILVLPAPFIAALPFLLFLRPRRALPMPSERVLDAGVTRGHGWVRTDSRLVWMPAEMVEVVVWQLDAARVKETLTPDGMEISGVRRMAVLDSWSLAWRLWAALSVASAGTVWALGVPFGLGLACLACIFGSGLLSLAVLLPYSYFWVWTVAVGTPMRVALRGRVLTVGFSHVIVGNPEVAIRFHPGPTLSFVQEGELVEIEAPYAMLLKLEERIRSLPPMGGSAEDVPAGLRRIADRT